MRVSIIDYHASHPCKATGPPIARRPTIADVAREAGVSVATVDRVLNRRHPVRQETAQRVLAAAEALGFHATGLLKLRLNPDLPQRTFAFILQKESHVFFQALAAALEAAARAAPGVRGRAIVVFAGELTPALIVERLAQVAPRADAVALVSVDHPSVSNAVEALHRQGKPVFALLTGLTAPARAGYVGIDNRKAGRTAAWLVARTAAAPGEVGLIVGSHRYLGHEMREIGFRSYFREHAPAFRVLETLVNLEDPAIAYEAMLDLLKRHPALAGVYVAGGGMEGVIAAIRDENRAGQLSVIVNELTPDSRAALIDDVATAVIATPVALVSARLVEAMVHALEGALPDSPAQLFLPFEVFISENI